jgi:hypothetical protein
MLPLARLEQAQIDCLVEAIPGGAANIQDIYGLAPLQEGILFHHLMGTRGDIYLSARLFSFDSREGLDQFLAALRTVVNRHDILRTSIFWEGLNEPVQVVWRQVTVLVREIQTDPSGDAAAQLRGRFHSSEHRLDLRQAPLMQLIATQDVPNSRWLLLQFDHHIISDHVALQTRAEEMQAWLAGEQDRLPPPVPFRNFVAHTRTEAASESHASFFCQMLGSVSEPTAPFGLTELHWQTSSVQEARLEIPGTLAQRIREQARAAGVSVASLYHLAYAAVLARVSEQSGVVFGTLLFGRMGGYEGADRSLGLFMNTLPIHIVIDDRRVLDSLRATHDLLAELMTHEHASLALAQRCSGVRAPTPLFYALLNYRHQPLHDRSAERQRGIELLHSEDRTHYPFSLTVDDLGGSFLLTAHVEESISSQRVCMYMQTALDQIVTALQSTPELPVSLIEIIPADEQQLLLQDWNAEGAHGIEEEDYARIP